MPRVWGGGPQRRCWSGGTCRLGLSVSHPDPGFILRPVPCAGCLRSQRWVVVRGGQQRLSGLWAVLLGGVLPPPTLGISDSHRVSAGFSPPSPSVLRCWGVLMNSTPKSRPSWGLCPSWGPSNCHTQHPLCSHGRFGCRSGWLELPTACFEETVGILGTLRCLSSLFWGYHGD